MYTVYMIELRNIGYEVEGKTILKDVSIAFPSKTITVITGQNGAGKSTLVRLIMGLWKATSGAVYWNGEDITELSVEERAKRGITIALQQPVAFKGLSVRKLIEVASGKNESVAGICEYLSAVGLCAQNYIGRALDNTLSGGELKRIELAMALAKGGEVYLFDEPEAGIDLWSFDALTELFRRLRDKTVVIVSHQKKILEIADRIAVLGETGGVTTGSRDEMLQVLEKPRVCEKLGR